MDTENLSANSRVHHGHNITRLRWDKNMERSALEKILKMTPQEIIELEETKVVGDDVLQKLADAFGVSIREFKAERETAPTTLFENNTFNYENSDGNSNDAANVGSTYYISNGDGKSTTFHGSQSKTLDQISDLYKTMISMEKEKSELLLRINTELENMLKSKLFDPPQS